MKTNHITSISLEQHLGMTAEECQNVKSKIDRCHLKDGNYCPYRSEKFAEVARNAYGIPMINHYYLCNKEIKNETKR